MVNSTNTYIEWVSKEQTNTGNFDKYPKIIITIWGHSRYYIIHEPHSQHASLMGTRRTKNGCEQLSKARGTPLLYLYLY
ncbi:hypothetical protein BLOT_012958 [Blomia tropicalis]|nr:hypothetical protein BLOT_012958 [Blomia tropicalis]